MHIQRTAPDTSKREPWLGATPTFRNFNSHWWDGGQIYGHDHATQMKIRSKRDGKIKFDGDMLPEDLRSTRASISPASTTIGGSG